MAKIELRHLDIQDDGSYIIIKKMDSNLTDYGQDFISVIMCDENGDDHVIHFDKSTAIRLSKTLRTEINKIES